MDVDDLEDMLFGFASSQESFDQVDDIDIDSDDEMLDDGLDSDVDLWDYPAERPLTPPTTDAESDAAIAGATQQARIGGDPLHRPDATAYPLKDRNFAIARVENMLEGIVDALADGNELSITLKSRPAGRQDRRLTRPKDNIPPPKKRVISFPGSNAQEAWRFTVLVRILELVHSCLVDDVIMTKRDIYYRHPDLFIKQSVVDRYVDELACTFGVTRSLLNVTAAAKGLVAGNFSLRRADGSSLNCLSEKEGILIPKILDSDVLDLAWVRWILVIEKEASFRSVLSSPQWMGLGPQGLLVTAKGYPDLASRKFLRQMAEHGPHIPMFVLVDFDPDGIAIMSTYKYGSSRLAHEELPNSGTPALGLPQLRWIGVQSHQIGRTPVAERDTERGATLDDQSSMRLTPRDRRKACQMLEWDVCAEDGPEPAWRRELQTMLMLNVKAEMQMLEERPGGLASWLQGELSRWLHRTDASTAAVPAV